MSQLELLTIESIDALRAVALAWDDLWTRSDVALPTLRAPLLIQWFEHFAPDAALRLLVVRDGNKLLAALPLFESRRRFLSVGGLPNNEWSPSGDLLLDPNCDQVAVLDLLATALSAARWPLTWLGDIQLATPRWQAFVAALDRRGLRHAAVERCLVGQVELSGAWEQYLASRSRNHRRYLCKAMQKAEAEVSVELSISQSASDPNEWTLRDGFELEQSGWKGRSGGAVMSRPGVREFYERQAALLESLGQLQLTFLEVNGELAAFEYGWRSKGIYFTPKVAYDERYERLSPGQLLRRLLLERIFEQAEFQAVDFIGHLTDATERWTTKTYPISDLVIATPGLGGRLLLHGYTNWWPRLKRWRNGWRRTSKPPTPAAEARESLAPDDSTISPSR